MVAVVVNQILNATSVPNLGESDAGADDDEDNYVPYDERPETYIVPVVFLIILVVGVTGNGILVLTLLRHANMRNVPNTYVLSLALGDLLVIVTCVPFTSILYTIESWPWGLAVCKLSECAKDISIGVSVFTLTALSAERYCAIVNPIRRHVVGLSAKPLTVLTASMIWILASILAMPAALFSHVPTIHLQGNHTILICSPFPDEFVMFGMELTGFRVEQLQKDLELENGRDFKMFTDNTGRNYQKGMVLFKFLAYYAIPLCVIAGFYLGMARHLELSTRNMPGEVPGGGHRLEQIRARKKVGKMVIAFVIVFVVCFLPYHTFMLWFHFCPSSRDDYDDFWHAFRIVGFCLSFVNSCVNPIALYFVSGAFRKRFNEYLCYCLPVRSGGACVGVRGEKGNGCGKGEGAFSRRGRGGDGTLYGTSFSSTFRRHAVEPNSTALFEMGSEISRPA